MKFFGHFSGRFFVNAFLHIFNQRHHIAHAQNTAGNAIGIKWFQSVDFFTDTHEFNRFSGNLTHRQSRTAARIAVHFGQNHTRQRQCLVKCLCRIHRILTQHGIHHEKCLHRMNGSMNSFDFIHHLFINRQTSGCIHHQHVIKMLFRIILCRQRNLHRFLRCIRREKIHIHLFGQQAQLLDGRRTVHVCRHQQNFLFLVLVFEQFRQLADRRCFTGTLQTRHQHNRGRCACQIQRTVFTAHQFGQLFVHNTKECLVRR